MTPYGFSGDRKLMALAEQGATVEFAALALDRSIPSIQKQAAKLGISISDGRLTKRHSVRLMGTVSLGGSTVLPPKTGRPSRRVR